MDDSSNDDDEARAARRRLVDLVTWNTDRAIATQASDQDPDRELRRSELDRVLDVAMNELAPADRTLLSLRFQDELSAAEIAPLMHFATPFHVYRRINHLLSGLRQRLAQLGVQSPLP
jgi:RNA polymerase sigma factor (sigma-70 family)